MHLRLRSFMVSAVALSALSAPIAHAQTTDEKLEILTQEVERLKQEVGRSARAAATDGFDGPGHTHSRPALAAEQRGADKTFVGAYGEMHYNNLDSKQEVDFHRFILFVGHNFTDRIRFFSELELEHAIAGEGKNGEIQIEQAYLEFDLTQNHYAKAGVLLVPAGIINETHEPPTFYGVERNTVETNIIPTTWREGGVGLSGKLGPGWAYDLMLSEGLQVAASGANAFNVRSGRQGASEANADEGAVTARLRWTGLPGIEWAAMYYYQPDIAQRNSADNAGALLETHAIFNKGPFGLRALYARWDIDGDEPAALGRDEQYGWYLEPSFKVTRQIGVFARYNEWDTEAGNGTASKKKQTDVGFNYWPHENVVIKFDVQSQSGAVNDDGFNLGVGYMF